MSGADRKRAADQARRARIAAAYIEGYRDGQRAEREAIRAAIRERADAR